MAKEEKKKTTKKTVNKSHSLRGMPDHTERSGENLLNPHSKTAKNLKGRDKEKISSKKVAAEAEVKKPPVKKEKALVSVGELVVDESAAQIVALSEPRSEKIPGRERYFEAVGRRKTAIARVRLFTRAGDFIVNDKPYSVYFSALGLQKIVEEALQKMKLWGRFKVTARIKGGGAYAQAEALRHGLSRCLVKFNPDFRKRLRRADFLKRDPRMKERKKPGLKRARKAPQWSKR